MSRKLVIVCLCGLICLLGTTVALAYNEAPMLKTLVAAGELPPVEERLPEEPLVVKPFEEIGKYGGIIHLAMLSASQYAPASQSVMEYMLMMDRKFENVIPNIAKGWKFSKDGKTFTLYLRKGMKWSDGARFTVDDILFWWEDVVLNDELTPIKPSEWKPGDELMKVKKVDDYTIELHFAVPFWSVIYQFSSAGQRGGQGWCFLPKHALEKYHIKYNPEADELAKKEGYEVWWKLFNLKKEYGSTRQQWPDIPSLGPWVTKKVLLDGVIYERNPYYFKIDTAGNQLPYIDEIRGTFFNDRETHIMRMITGQIDFEAGWNVDIDSYPVVMENAKRGGYRVWPGRNTWGAAPAFFFNQNYTEDPVLGDILRDVRFRQALSLAIDREEINEIVALGKGVPRQATVHPSCSFYEDRWAKSYAQYNPEKANEILDEMGLDKRDKDGYRLRPDGKRLSIVITAGEVRRHEELMKEYWEKVGVKTVLKQMAVSYYIEFTGAGKSQVYEWPLDSIIEPLFFMGRAAWAFGSTWLRWAPEWRIWYDTDGEEGIEPPDKVKRMWSLYEKIPYLPEKERNEAAKEVCDIEAENLFFIGTIGMAPRTCMANINLGNVNKEAFADSSDCGGIRNNWLEEYFWKK